MKQERRTFTGTVIARAEGEGMPKVIGGIAAVINSVTDLGYFEEVIEAGRLITHSAKSTTFAVCLTMRPSLFWAALKRALVMCL